MRHRLDVILVFQIRGNLRRVASGTGAAGAVGDADKVEREVGELVERVVNRLDTAGFLGGKYLQGENRILFFKNC